MKVEDDGEIKYYLGTGEGTTSKKDAKQIVENGYRFYPEIFCECKVEGDRMNFEELREKIIEWASKRNLLSRDNADKQFLKFLEEAIEFKDAKKDLKWVIECIDVDVEEQTWTEGQVDVYKRNMMFEFGDILVTLIILAEQLKIDPVLCLELAYAKIKYRKGRTINGTFVKEEDL